MISFRCDRRLEGAFILVPLKLDPDPVSPRLGFWASKCSSLTSAVQAPQPGGMPVRLGGDGSVFWSRLACWEQRLAQGSLHGWSGGGERLSSAKAKPVENQELDQDTAEVSWVWLCRPLRM